MRDMIANQKVDEIVKASEGAKTKEQILDEKANELSAQDSDMKYLIQEYHDGLLLYEISNELV